jgi:hypothetical protein
MTADRKKKARIDTANSMTSAFFLVSRRQKNQIFHRRCISRWTRGAANVTTSVAGTRKKLNKKLFFIRLLVAY